MSDIRHLKMHAKAMQADDGHTEFVASTPNVDRAGDVIEPNWDLGAYARNPVILYGHDYGSTPIGKAVRTWVEGGNLRIKVKWVPAEIDPFAEKVRLLYAGGFLNAVSVGFRPMEFASERTAGGGSRITKSELLEVSAVPVPMNAEALIAGKGVRPVFDERRPVQRVKVDADLIAAFLRGPTMRDEIAAALETVTKMDEPMPPEPKPEAEKPAEDAAPSSPAAMVDEVLRLLTPKDGTIAQAEFDAALALLGKLKDAVGQEDAGEDEPAAEEEPPPAKGIRIARPDPVVAELKQLKQSVDRLAALREKDFFEDVENDPLEAALSDPAFLASLGSQLN